VVGEIQRLARGLRKDLLCGNVNTLFQSAPPSLPSRGRRILSSTSLQPPKRQLQAATRHFLGASKNFTLDSQECVAVSALPAPTQI
jgi:hypothetical protein